MPIEYEVRMLEIHIDDTISQLRRLGAQEKGVFHQKRYVYDFIPAQKDVGLDFVPMALAQRLQSKKLGHYELMAQANLRLLYQILKKLIEFLKN